MTTETIPLTQDHGGARPTDRAGGLRPEPKVSALSGAHPSRKPTQCSTCPYWLPSDIGRCPLCHEDQHEMSIVSTGHQDEAVCSCGWSSEPYWDGVEWAEADWRKHVRDSDSRRMAETGTGSVRSTASAGPTAIAQPSSIATALKGERA